MGSAVLPGDRRTNRVARSTARTYGGIGAGGWDVAVGWRVDTMARTEKVPLFLVICVTAVLIDDHRFFPLSLENRSALGGGVFPDRPLASKPYFRFGPLGLPQNHPSTLCSVWLYKWLPPTHLYSKTSKTKENQLLHLDSSEPISGRVHALQESNHDEK